MNANVLIVFYDLDLGMHVKELLEEELGREGHIILGDLVRNESKAKEKLRDGKFDLVITQVNIPTDKNALPAGEERRGLALLQSLRRDHIEIPAILVSVRADAELFSETQNLNKCYLVAQKIDRFARDLINYSRKALNMKAETQEHKRVDLDIVLEENKREYKFEGVGFTLDGRFKPLRYVDKHVLRKLAKKSKRIEKFKDDWPDWEEALQEIGEELMVELFEKNSNLLKEFCELKGKVGGLENFRIRFNVERNVYPVALESLFEKDEDYWMLQAPIYRKLHVDKAQEVKPLFQDNKADEARANCLIIEANVDGVVPDLKNRDGQPVALTFLRNVSEECAWLETHLVENRDRFRIRKVKRILCCKEQKLRKEIKILENGKLKECHPFSKETSFAEQLHTLLLCDTWHLIHYAGHSYYHAKEGTGGMGYVFFPGQRGIVPRDIEIFSEWLGRANTRFVYLSSCHSSEKDFVFELARKQIPAVIGFRWDVNDEKAINYTKIFYNHLFKERSLEYGFVSTRKEMHENDKKDLTWASPILVMQSSD